MLIVHVMVHVNRESLAPFLDATRANVRASALEPGVTRFECIQQLDDPTRFLLVEHYRTADALELHRGTPHYATWRDAVASMMAEPRERTQYLPVPD